MPTLDLGGMLGELAREVAAFLAVLLAASALHKALTLRASAASAVELTGIPSSVGTTAVGLAVLLETLASTGLLTVRERGAAALGALALFGAYLALLVRAVRAGRAGIDCGCRFGGAAGHRIGSFEIGRNAVLMLLAVLVAGADRAGLGGALEVRQLLIGFASFAVYVALETVAGLAHHGRVA